jgi:hypothetical protein
MDQNNKLQELKGSLESILRLNLELSIEILGSDFVDYNLVVVVVVDCNLVVAAAAVVVVDCNLAAVAAAVVVVDCNSAVVDSDFGFPWI